MEPVEIRAPGAVFGIVTRAGELGEEFEYELPSAQKSGEVAAADTPIRAADGANADRIGETQT